MKGIEHINHRSIPLIRDPLCVEQGTIKCRTYVPTHRPGPHPWLLLVTAGYWERPKRVKRFMNVPVHLLASPINFDDVCLCIFWSKEARKNIGVQRYRLCCHYFTLLKKKYLPSLVTTRLLHCCTQRTQCLLLLAHVIIVMFQVFVKKTTHHHWLYRSSQILKTIYRRPLPLSMSFRFTVARNSSLPCAKCA